MKKTMMKVVGALAMLSALFLAGCKNDLVQGDMSGDTLYTLSAPSVTAKAYPGMVVASWTEVPDAASYKVQVLIDGVETATDIVDIDKPKTLSYSTAENGREYKVRVSAMSSSTPSRAIAVRESAFAEATATSIVPPSGTTALQLAAYEGGFDGTVKTTDKVLKADGIKIVKDKNDLYVSFQAKCYLNYNVQVINEYGVLTNSTATGTSSVAKNDQWINKKLPIPTYGKYSVVVTASAKYNAGIYKEEAVAAAETYTYKQSTVTIGAFTANYIDNVRAEGEGAKNVVRLTWWQNAIDGKVQTPDMFKVYYKTAYSNELVEVTKAEEKDEEGNVTSAAVVAKESPKDYEWDDSYLKTAVQYYLDTEVADPTIKYTFYVVTAIDDEIASEEADVAPKALDYTTAGTVSGSVQNTKIVDDAKVNDIVWTITKANKYQTFKAYALKKDFVNGKGYTNTVILPEDFDTTTELTGAVTTDDVTYTLIQKDVAESKNYLMVVFSETDKKSKTEISGPVTIVATGEPTLNNATLSVTAYDNAKNDLTNVTGYVENKNDVVVTFTDKIDALTEKVSTYTYKLYKAPVTFDKKADKSAVYEVVGTFVEVEGFAMVENKTPNAAASDTLNYAAIVNENDVAAGTYIYKVVKTNAETGKYASTTARITIADVDDLTSQMDIYAKTAYDVKYDTDTEKWVANDKNASSKKNRITVYMSNIIQFVDKNTNQVRTGYKDLSAGVTLTLYKAEKVNNQLSAVYTKVAAAFAEDKDAQSTGTVVTFTYADGEATPDAKDDVVTGRQFNIVDTVSTTDGVTYDYIIVASKDGYKDVTVTF